MLSFGFPSSRSPLSCSAGWLSCSAYGPRPGQFLGLHVPLSTATASSFPAKILLVRAVFTLWCLFCFGFYFCFLGFCSWLEYLALLGSVQLLRLVAGVWIMNESETLGFRFWVFIKIQIEVNTCNICELKIWLVLLGLWIPKKIKKLRSRKLIFCFG